MYLSQIQVNYFVGLELSSRDKGGVQQNSSKLFIWFLEFFTKPIKILGVPEIADWDFFAQLTLILRGPSFIYDKLCPPLKNPLYISNIFGQGKLG